LEKPDLPALVDVAAEILQNNEHFRQSAASAPKKPLHWIRWLIVI